MKGGVNMSKATTNTKKNTKAQERANIKHELFVDAYLKMRNATKAAIVAGYSAKSAKQQGYQLLQRDDVKELITVHKQKILDENVAEEREILQTLTRVMRGEEYDEVATAAGTYITAPTLKDRLKSAQMLGNYRGMWTDKKVIDANIRPEIIDDVDDDNG